MSVTDLHVYMYLTIMPVDSITILLCSFDNIPYLDPGSAPQNFTAVASGRTSAWFSWEPPSVDDHNGVISYYFLRLIDASFNLTDITINTTNSSYSIETLEEYVRYSCQVAAGTTAGVGPYTTPLLITTQQDGENKYQYLNSACMSLYCQL